MSSFVEVEIARRPGDHQASVVINLGSDSMHVARDAKIHVHFEGTAHEIEAIARALLGTVEKAKRDGTLAAEALRELPVPKVPFAWRSAS